MILPIYLYGQPVLRKVCKDIPLDYKNLEEIVNNMFDTLKNAQGVGLAGPQVGLNYRILVLDLTPLEEEYPEFKGVKKVFINAHMAEAEGEEILMDEGCLSIPGIQEKVPRMERIRIQYLDENLQAHEDEFTGYFARVIQHEYDHIEGKLFIDHIAGIRKQMIKSKLNAIMKGKVKCSYKVKAVGKNK